MYIIKPSGKMQATPVDEDEDWCELEVAFRAMVLV